MTDAGARLGVISNPRSGHNREHLPAVRECLARCPGLLLHRETQGVEDIPEVLQSMARAGVDTLVINGGDGTVAAVLGELLESRTFTNLPRIALLPAGTANMSAGDVGVRGGLRRAARHLLDWSRSPPSEQAAAAQAERSLLRLVSADGRVRHGMFLGAGAVISGTEYAHREIHARGLRDDASLALSVARTLWGLVRGDPAFSGGVQVRLRTAEGAGGDYDTLILALSTLRRLSFGMRPFWGEPAGPLRLTLIERRATRFLPRFLRIIAGRPGRRVNAANGYHSFSTAALTLTLDGEVNLDGEVFRSEGPLAITATAPLRFLRPGS